MKEIHDVYKTEYPWHSKDEYERALEFGRDLIRKGEWPLRDVPGDIDVVEIMGIKITMRDLLAY